MQSPPPMLGAGQLGGRQPGPRSNTPIVHAEPVAPVAWDEDRTAYAPRLVLQGGSYLPARLFACPASADWRAGIASPGGNHGYANRILPAGTPLKLSLSPSRQGMVEFDADVVIPTLFDLTGPYPDPWMSLTPMEMITQRPGVRRAHGTVLVGGLGLGWFLGKVHDRPEVQRVVLVEACRELLDWYGHDLCRRLPKVTDVICGDVYDHIGRLGAGAKYLLDIWKGYGECLLDGRFLRCRRLFKHCWGWGEEAAIPESGLRPVAGSRYISSLWGGPRRAPVSRRSGA